MAVQRRRQVYSGHEQIVAHVVLVLHRYICPKICGHGHVGGAGHIAVSVSMERSGEIDKLDGQMSPIVPDWTGEVAVHCIDEDFVLVEFQNDIREISFALHAFAVVHRFPGGRSGVEGFLDGFGYRDIGGKRQSASWDR